MTIFEKAVDQIAPHLRDGALVVLRSTVYPGHDRLRRPAPRRARLHASTSRSARSGSPRATPSRSSTRCPRSSAPTTTARRNGRPPSSGTLTEQDDPDDDQGSRAREALHEHLALHEVRGREPVLHDRRPGRRRLHERPARDPRGLPARRRPARARASPPVRACSRTRCSWRRSPPTTSRSARRRCRSTRACRPTSCRRSNAATAGSSGKTVGILGMAFKAESDDTAGVAQLQAAQAAVVGRRARPRAPIRTSQDDRLVPLDCVLDGERHPRPRRAAQGVPRPRRSAARTSSTSGAPSARGSGSSAHPRHRRRRVHQRLPRPGAARGRPRGHRARRLQQVRPAGQVATTTIRATASSRATPRTSALMRELAADCDQVVAAAAMIGGISYFHEFAYDLLAENERILASTFDAAIAAHRDGHLERIVVVSVVDGLRVGDRLPDARGRPADLAAAGLDLRLPEARLGVLRQGRLGAVPAAVHDRPAVQLRRHRRAPGGPRHGRHERQREARAVATSCRTSSSRSSRARTRSTSSARATRSATTRTAATSPTASASRWSRRRPSTTTSTSRPPRRRPCSSWPRPSGARSTPTAAPFHYVSDPPFEHDVQLRVPDVRKARDVLGFEATTTLDAMLDEVIPWIRAEVEAGRL